MLLTFQCFYNCLIVSRCSKYYKSERDADSRPAKEPSYMTCEFLLQTQLKFLSRLAFREKTSGPTFYYDTGERMIISLILTLDKSTTTFHTYLSNPMVVSVLLRYIL